MLRKLSTRNVLSLILSISLLLGTLCGGLNAFAEESEDTTLAAKAYSLSSDTTGAYQDYSKIDFDDYGKNLIPDSTVSQFDEDGKYKSYYDYTDVTGNTVANSSAWWDKAASRVEAFDNNTSAYKSMNVRGLINSDTTLSHTVDGSGVLSYSASWSSAYLPLPSLQAEKYYLVTAWINPSGSDVVTTRIRDNTIKNLIGEKKVYSTSGWKRVVWIYYTGSTAQEESIFEFNSKFSGYIDDVAVYQLDSAYAESCIAAGTLINQKDSDEALVDDYSTVVLTDQYSDDLFTVSDYYSENLIPDSIVSQFDGDEYKSYYTNSTCSAVANYEAWWDKAANVSAYLGGTTALGGLKENSQITSDSSYSHTADGSGALSINGGGSGAYLPLPKAEYKTYYVVTAWVNATSAGTTFSSNMNFARGTSSGQKNNWISASGWQRFTWIYYTGNTVYSEPYLYLYADKSIYVDDISVYKLDGAYAASCIEAGKLLSKKDFLPDAAAAINVTDSTEAGVYFGAYGENLIPDSTVSQFNEDGTYKSYYDLENDSTVGTVLNANAWWDKAANRYQYFTENRAAYSGMKAQGYVSADTTLSHTKDGSGALVLPGDTNRTTYFYLPLPSVQAKTYYLITAWAKVDNTQLWTELYYDAGQKVKANDKTFENNGWVRISWIYYTGADAHTEPMLLIRSNKEVYIDDIAMYELGDDYGTACVENKKLSANREIVLGDVNCDDEIDLLDLVRIKKVLAEVTSDYLAANADVDKDGGVATTDMAMLKQYLMGSITTFE